MKRKLVKVETYQEILKGSTNIAEYELTEAADVLAKTLDKDFLSLHCFTESTALYETLNGTYVHTSYDLDDNKLTFTNIEELIVDHDSKKQKMKESLSNMLDALMSNNSNKAEEHFGNYLNMFKFNEAKKFVKTKGDPKNNDFEEVEKEDSKKDKKGKKLPFWLKDKAKKGKDKDAKFKKSSAGKNHLRFKDAFKKKVAAKDKKLKEAFDVACNVLEYVDFVNLGSAIGQTNLITDEDNNPITVTVPTTKVRNEGKVLSFDWKTLNSKCKTMREEAFSLFSNDLFAKAVGDLRRENNKSNADAIESVLENTVQAFPSILYVTQKELANIIDETFKSLEIENYDDTTCNFMAEGLLMKATAFYEDKVQQIFTLASAKPCPENEDKFDYFKSVTEGFFPSIDKKFQLESQVFEDLYNVLENVYKVAERKNDGALKSHTAHCLNELADTLNGKIKADVELAEESANLILSFVETNLDGGVWNVSNKPHMTVNGDHPDMAKKASQGFAPSKDGSGNWGDEAPMIGADDMNYKGKHSKEARNKSWGNVGGKDTFPSLKNPYIPTPFGDATMKGEKGVDKANDSQGQWQSSDTWPALNNPYVPKAETPSTYKMKEKDLVVDA